MAEQNSEEDIIITGISCRLPESDNMEEFWDNLLSGTDMVTEDDRRWPPGLHGLPKKNGKLKDLSKFDGGFFGIPPKQVNTMDPQLRLLLEVTYEAIADSGVDPVSLKGQKVGVFMSLTNAEAHDLLSSDDSKITGYEMTGCNRAMLANRISYFFDLKGPSFSIDTAWSSGLEGLCNAVYAIREGRCDAAVVGATNLLLKPETSLQFNALNMLSPDGISKSFDESANGYCRSEGVVVIFVQNRTEAKRTYLQVVDILDNCDGYKEQGIGYPSTEMQKALLEQVYSKAEVDASRVSYVEADGTGTATDDPHEVNTIADMFCKDRTGPLLLGSVKSCMGHAEAAAGLAGIAKILLSVKYSKIPRNLHFVQPNPNIEGLLDGRIKVVAETTDWQPGITAINSFGFGGTNVHAILSPCVAEQPAKDSSRRLVVAAARTADVAEKIAAAIQESPTDLGFHCLINETLRQAMKTHPFRCFTILNGTKQITDFKKCERDRPVWFIFPGMGCQWSGMGRDMLDIPVFQNAIERCHVALTPLGFNLKQFLAECTESELAEDPMKASIGICSIQIGLIDVLQAVGIQPDGMVGHSVGELGCAYADNTLTAEQTILTAYWRGRCINEANMPLGAMAAVGLTWEEVNKLCPGGIVAACHNAETSVTISGLKKLVEPFVAQLQADGTFARMVNSSGISFHSSCMKMCAPALQSALQKIIPNAVGRTQRWISSSIPESKWQTSLAQTSSAEYHVNNLLSPVLFHQALQHVPRDAVVIEIGPHGLLQAILRRSFGPDVTLLSLMKRNEEDNVCFCLTNIGKCYLHGIEVNPMKLCPEITFPVAIETPMISPLVGWDHSYTWDVPSAITTGDSSSGRVIIDLNRDTYLQDHCINSRTLYPAGGFMMLAWQSFAKAHGKLITDTPVTMFDFRVHNASILPKTGTIEYTVMTSTATGNVEILDNDVLLASCRILDGCMNSHNTGTSHPDFTENGELALFTDEIYKELQIRGCDFGPDFQTLKRIHVSGRRGSVLWRNRVITYLDSLIQAYILLDNDRDLRLPNWVRMIQIDPQFIPFKQSDTAELDFMYDDATETIQAPGLTMTAIHYASTQRRLTHKPPILEEYCFVPHNERTSRVEEEVWQYYHSCLKVASHVCNGIDPKRQLDTSSKGTDPNRQFESSLATNSTTTHVNNVFTERPDEFVLKNYDFSSPKHSVLKYLTCISKTKQKGCFREGSCVDDLLFSHSINPGQLKCTLDMTLENVGVQMVRILYCTSSKKFGLAVLNQIKNQFHEYPHISFELSVASPLSEITAHLQDQEKNAICLPWNEALESIMKGQVNVVVVSTGCGCNLNKETIKQLLNLTSRLPEDTFCIIHKCELNPTLMKVLCKVQTDNGSNPTIDHFLRKSKLLSLADKSDGILSRLVLCRQKKKKFLKCKTVYVGSRDFAWVQDAQKQLNEIKTDKDSVLWFVAEGRGFSGIVGLIKCLLNESAGKMIRCIYSSDLYGEGIPRSFLPCGVDFAKLAEKDLVMNIYQNGAWGSFRKKTIIEDGVIKSGSQVYLDLLHHGDLTSLHWIQMPPDDLPESHLRLYIHFASLNFRDLMLATGRLNSEAVIADKSEGRVYLGLEASGMAETGERRMGIIPTRGLATEWKVPIQYTWRVPAKWSLREAASVPVAYATAYYALVRRAGLQRGASVLIHSAASSVGQAALRIAKSLDCVIYATVGTAEKVELLQNHYGLDRSRIANSRNTEFVHQFLKATKGKGIDVVLNSLADEKLQVSLDLVARHGHFLEIGKYDLSRNSKLGMAVFLRNISFHGIVLEYLLQPGHREWEMVSSLVEKGISDGVVVPLQTYVYNMQDTEKAFRFMAEGKHVGKVLIQIRSEEASRYIGRRPRILRFEGKFRPNQVSVPALTRTYFYSEKTYIVTGGLGGLGLEMVNWMVDRGARKLLLTSRSGVKHGYQRRMLDLWRSRGVRTVVSRKNVINPRETAQLIMEAKSMGPVGGVFHLAAVLHDVFFERHTVQTFRPVVDIKVQGCLNLDHVTRNKCAATLDWFVVFSSAAVCYGNAGQSNYGLANSFMERVCEKRHFDGLPGKALQWGFIGDVGMVQRNLGGNKLFHMGMVPQRIQSFLEVLDHFLQRPEVVLSSVVPASKETTLDSDPEKSGSSSRQDDIVAAVMTIIGVKEVSAINPDNSLSDLGLDSLMVTEIRQILGRRFDLQTSVTDIHQMTINSLKSIASRSEN